MSAFLTKPPFAKALKRALAIALARHGDLMKTRRMNEDLNPPSQTALTERPARGGRDKAPDDEEIFRRLHNAIVVRQLEPGTKLGEEALCEVFGVSRAQIRRFQTRSLVWDTVTKEESYRESLPFRVP